MTKIDPSDDTLTRSAALIPLELLDLAGKKLVSLLAIQKELVQSLECINQELFDRAKREAELASEFVGKLAGVRSIPEATSTYREWATREMGLLADEGHKMFVHGEKLMHASNRLFSNGMPSSAP